MIIRSSHAAFRLKLNQLHTQIISNKCHDILFNFGKKNNIRQYRKVNQAVKILNRNVSNEKIHRYTSNIIGLYGALENFVESLIDEVVDNLNMLIPNSDNLPEAIMKNYLCGSVDVIRKSENAGKLQNVNKLDVVESLFKTLNQHSSSLMPESFYNISGGNYKYEVICNCFVKMGFSNIATQIPSIPPCSTILNKEYGDLYLNEPQSRLFGLIDDLVERRNDIAHGGMSITIINDREFCKYLDFMDKFADSLCTYLRCEMARLLWNNYRKPRLSISHIYSNNIIVVKTITEKFEKGGWIICKYGGGDPSYCFRQILSIQVDDVEYEEYYCVITTEVGLKLDNSVTNHTTFVVI